MTSDPEELHALRQEVSDLQKKLDDVCIVLSEMHLTLSKLLTHSSQAAHVAIKAEFIGRDAAHAEWQER